MQKVLTLYNTSIGKKAVMALTGLVLFGFVIGHCLGNLQVYLGPLPFNRYAAALKSMGGLLWAVRAGLAAVFIVHLVAAYQLWRLKRTARSHRYRVKQPEIAATYASKTMFWTGPLLLLFVLYHVAHFTYPGLAFGDYSHSTHNIYGNVLNGFRVPWVSSLYIASQMVLGLHLYHGAWSLLQSLGISNPLRNDRWRGGAQAIAMAVVVANITIPLAVVFGVVR
jgi:succinate dehydrogenase / fumarate reductase, cytochrome b subunit